MLVVERQLDRVLTFYDQFEGALKSDIRWSPLEKVQASLDHYEITGCKRMVPKLEERLNALEPEEWRDNDGNLQQTAVSKMLALLVGSFPTSNLPDASVFTQVLLDDVMAIDPGFVELETACRKLRHSQKFMPAISEVIAAIKSAKQVWSKRYTALWCIEEVHEDLGARVTAEQERRAAEKAAHERKVAKAQALAVGDRVRNLKLGAGTVSDVIPIDGYGVHYRVRFDASTERYVAGAAYLERLLSGDDGFEPAALPMLEHRESVPMVPIETRTPIEVENS